MRRAVPTPVSYTHLQAAEYAILVCQMLENGAPVNKLHYVLMKQSCDREPLILNPWHGEALPPAQPLIQMCIRDRNECAAVIHIHLRGIVDVGAKPVSVHAEGLLSSQEGVGGPDA